MKRVYFFAGKHQRLTGEVRKLAKPLAVLTKAEDAEGEGEGGEALKVQEVVRYKIVFSQRPEPVGEVVG